VGDLRWRSRAAAAIKATVSALEDSPDQEPEEGKEAEEGKILTRLHRIRERDRHIVVQRKAKAFREHGTCVARLAGLTSSLDTENEAMASSSAVTQSQFRR
jgi:5-methylcytosine-specific restriction enzyme A